MCSANNSKCANCGEEISAFIKGLGALSNIGSDHLRKIAALKDKFEKKQKYADALLAKVEQINDLAMKSEENLVLTDR